jgi:hypothetical protein
MVFGAAFQARPKRGPTPPYQPGGSACRLDRVPCRKRQRAQTSARARVGQRRIEVRALVAAVESRQVELAEAEVDRKPWADAPVILEVHRVVPPAHADAARCIDGCAVRLPEQKRCEADAAARIAIGLSGQRRVCRTECDVAGSGMLTQPHIGRQLKQVACPVPTLGQRVITVMEDGSYPKSVIEG